MFQTNLLPSLSNFYAWVAQLPDGGVGDTPAVSSGPQFFIALISGVILTFGFQLLLTNLSVAAGISYLGRRSTSEDINDKGDSLGETVRKVGTAAGIWTLVTVSLALFIACFLAVQLSLINNPFLGVILGLVIWGLYFSLLVWVSSTTVGSLVGSVVNAATSGFQSIVGTATAALGAKAASHQVVATAEAAAAAVRRELTAGVDPEGLKETLQDYLSTLRSPELDVQDIRREFEQILQSSDLQGVSDPEQLWNIDHQAFVDLVRSRTDLSNREVNRIADQLEAAWKQTVNQLYPQQDSLSQLVDYLRSAKPEQLLSKDLGQRLDQFLDEMRNRRTAQSPSRLSQVLNALMSVLIGRTDLSDLDLEKITRQLEGVRNQITDQASLLSAKLSGQPPKAAPYSVIRADVENYLLNTYAWQISEESIEQDFRNLIYDPEADAGTIRRELEQLQRLDFVELLQSRGLLTQERIHKLSQQLDAVRLEVLQEVTQIELQEKAQDLQLQVEQYLHTTPKEALLSTNQVSQDFKPLLEDAESSVEQLRDRLAAYTQEYFVSMLWQRSDLNEMETEQLATELERNVQIVLADAEGWQQAAIVRITAQRRRLEDYLRNTKREELNPEGIQRDLQTLLHNPEAGVADLRLRLSHFDRETLVQLLSQRQDISETEANHILDQVEANWNRIVHAPQKLMVKVQEQYDKTIGAIAEYLRNTEREELNPEGLRRDLSVLLKDPATGSRALRERLSQVDRNTLVQLLSQRQDLTEAEANRIVDQVEESIRSLVRAPKRLAMRAQTHIQDFKTSLEEYLRNTEKEELNPEGINRDLKLLLSDPRLGIERIGNRLSHIDRSTLVALLSQRQDMTAAEANQVVDRILAVRDQVNFQIQAVQRQVQSVIDSLFARIRTYLNSLNRPELNYEGIKQDIRKLFDDPQVGFEAIRDRLSQFDRDTLVAILSSRDDISEADVNRIIDQVEGVRSSLLRRAERLQREVQHRLEAIKLQAQQQAEATRKAAENAAWWLFSTALVSAIFSGFAGGIAVIV